MRKGWSLKVRLSHVIGIDSVLTFILLVGSHPEYLFLLSELQRRRDRKSLLASRWSEREKEFASHKRKVEDHSMRKTFSTRTPFHIQIHPTSRRFHVVGVQCISRNTGKSSIHISRYVSPRHGFRYKKWLFPTSARTSGPNHGNAFSSSLSTYEDTSCFTRTMTTSCRFRQITWNSDRM